MYLHTITTIFPRHQIRCLSHNLAACCTLCYTSAVEWMNFSFRYVIVHALRSILIPQCMGVVMISFSLNLFKKSSDFVIHNINKKKQKTMALRSDNHGVGAIVLALLRFIHPSEHIHNKFPNIVQGQRLENCLSICQEVKKVSRKEQLVLVVCHEDFKNPDNSYIELHGVK